MRGSVQRELPFDAAESQTLGIRANFMYGNRETPEASSNEGVEERSDKATGRTADVHATGESDALVVPKKRTNEAGEEPAEESMEGRRAAKGNVAQTTMARTLSRKAKSLGLWGVRQAARRAKGMRFTALLHHVTPELLRASYFDLKRQAAPGVDGVTWQQYASDWENRLADLHARIHRGTYRAKPSKRAWIPKSDGKQRPLGIASLEDKIVQHAVKTVLECVYEADFLGFSYGFRPRRGCHNALDALWVGITRRKVNWVLDADIRGFYDAIDHKWMQRFLEHRIGDRRLLRLIRKWMRAGVSEAGEWSRSTVGVPQGSVISPILANVFLHYVLDVWVNQWRKRHARGDVIVVRYADDFVMGFQYQEDAERCLADLQARLRQFGLELHPEKTRLIEFGRYASERRQKRDEGEPETFNFLGFTHICGKTRKGMFTIHRKSMKKRLRTKLLEIKEELKRAMHRKVQQVGRWLRSVVQGWFNYHAVPGNCPSLAQFLVEVEKLWLRVLRRRSQRGRHWNWTRFHRLVRRWLPRPRILHPYPDKRLTVST
jgi:RNA-directed DNA polymerase